MQSIAGMSMPNEIQERILFPIAPECRVSVLSSVCKKWKELFESESYWRSLLERKIKDLTYEVDLSSAKTSRDKVKLLIEVGNRDFQGLISQFCIVDAKTVITKKSNLTALFLDFIADEQFEILAKFLLLRPSFDVKQVVQELWPVLPYMETPERLFCFDLLIKLHYDLTEFFKNFTTASNRNKMALTLYPFRSQIPLTLSDFMQSGCDLSSFEKNTDNVELNYSSLISLLLVPLFCHSSEGFLSKTFLNTITSFTDEKLLKYKKSAPSSEEEVKQFIMNVLFNCKLNLNIKTRQIFHEELQQVFDPKVRKMLLLIPEGTAFSQFQAIAELPDLPPDNVLKAILAEYEEKKASDDSLHFKN